MLEVGRTVGRYEILREIGRGGMAVVYLARQTDLDRFVALKQLVSPLPGDPTFARRFVREARVAGKLSHPNIVTIHDFFEFEGTPYIAMEYVPRGSLRPWIGHLSPAQIAGVLEGVLAGLAHGEQHGIVHRDLKPENVLVTADGGVQIADYGIAKATTHIAGGSAMLTAAGTTVGTPAYMAPEQAMADPDIGPWTDLYSLGCMTYELFTGRTPFHDTEAPMALLLRHVNDPIPPAITVDPSIDPAISSWIDRLLVKDPARRTRSSAQAWDEFEEPTIRLLGPRWRRAARLCETDERVATARPLTPAPFKPPAPAPPVASEPSGFVTYAPPPPSRPPTSDDLELSPNASVLGPAASLAPAVAEHVAAAPPPPRPAGPDAVEPQLAATVAPRRPLPPEDPPPPPPHGARRRLAALAALAVVALLVVVAALQSGQQAPTRAPVRPVTLASGPLALTLPAGWRAAAVPAAAATLHLADPAAATSGGSSASVVLGVAGTGADRAALVHEDVLDAAGLDADAIPARTQVRLARGVQAYRYRDVALPRRARVTLYVVPTVAGVATVACLPPPVRPDAFETACARISGSLRIAGAPPYPLGADRDYATAVNRELGAVERRTADAHRALRRAKTRTAQATAATSLAGGYERASSALLDLTLSPADRALNARLARALGATADAYAALARAARRGDGAGYRRAAARAIDRRRSLRDGLTALSAAGYGELLTVDAAVRAVPALRPARRPPPATGGQPPPAAPTPAPQAEAPPQTAPTPAPSSGGGSSGGTSGGDSG
jgi:serine/threonine protein kinase